MVKHIVMWKLRGDTAAQRRAEAERLQGLFEVMRPQIPGLRLLEIGLDHSGADHACDVVLYSEFESQAALRAYADHPAHRQVREALGDVRTARYQVDYAVADAAPRHG